MSLLGGGLARIFAAAFGSTYLPATLHRASPVVYDDGGSVISPAGFADVPCRGQLESGVEELRPSEGFVDGAQRIFILTATLTGEPTTNDQVTVSDPRWPGVRWQIISIDRDPAGAYWDLRARPA